MNARSRSGLRRESTLYVLAGVIAGIISMSFLHEADVFRIDRFQHFLVSAGLFVTLFALLGSEKKNMVTAALGALAIGFLKEFGDPTFQALDITANFAGVLLAVVLASLVQFPAFPGWTKASK